MKRPKKLTIKNKNLIFFLSMIVFGAILILLYLAVTGNAPQRFKDVVIEFTAIHGSNKSAERNLFYIFSGLGILAYGVFYFIKQRNQNESELRDNVTTKSSIYPILALVILSGTHYFVYASINWLLISGLLIAVILLFIDEKLVISGMILLFEFSYALCGLYRLWVLFGGMKSLSMMSVSLISCVMTLFVLNISKENQGKSFNKSIMLAQLLIPFTMLTYLASTYKYGEDYISIHIPYRIHILVWTFICAFLAEAVINIKRNWNVEAAIGNVLTYGTFISIMSFNRFSGSGSIIPTDLHHPFENIIGYSQIFELGQSAFEDYLPVSGMYSIVHGFFLDFFGHGQVSFYYLTTNLFFLFVICIIVFLLKQQLRGEWIMLISLIFMVSDYNRITFIVPTILLLIWPKLIEKKNIWLKAWFLSSFLQGLYYPVYGAAVCAAFIPLGLWQIVTYAQSGKLKADIRTWKFWGGWLICVVPVALSGNLLLGTFKHMKAMSGQTVYADGIARFGQMLPDNFMSYIQLLPTRMIFYYMASYLILICLVWLSFVLFLNLGRVKTNGLHVNIENPVPAFIALAVSIMLLVAFSYTVIRLDINSIYARSAGVVFAAFVILIILLGSYSKFVENKLWIYGFAVFIMAIVTAEGFGSMESCSKLSAYYTVPENYVHAVNDPVERLGECFVEQESYDTIENTYSYAQGLNSDKSYLGIVDNFGLYYLCGIKGDSVMETNTISGYGAAQETVDLLRLNSTIVGSNISSLYNYYFYYWLINSGEYIWNPETRTFYPNDGSVSTSEIVEQNHNIDIAFDGIGMGKVFGSWGKSMTTLQDIFSNPEIECNVTNNDISASIDFEKMYGNDADFMYIEFADQDETFDYTLFNEHDSEVQDSEANGIFKCLMKKNYNKDITVFFSWLDDSGNSHSINCGMDEGKLLVPLGGCRGWLLNDHSNITITVMQGEEVLRVPEITDVEMLKIQEVK